MKTNFKKASLLLAAVCMAAGCTSASSSAASEGSTSAAMTAGTYTGTATGMDGTVKVDVTVDETSITSIEIVEENETEGVGDEALVLIADEIMETQSIAVDTVAGATVSSAAMKAAVTDALSQAGADTSEWKREITVETSDETFDYDVVVVGGGIAGLVTAAQAHQAGANVALVEKLGVIGGSGVFSSGIFLGADSDETLESFKTTWVKRNKLQERNQVSEERVEAMSEVVIDALGLLTTAGVDYTFDADKGFCFATATEKAEENAASIELATAEVSAKGGAQLMNSLESYLIEEGVDIYMNTKAEELIVDDNGAVTGVVCSAKTGTKTFNVASVVLATGGYARNNDLALELAEDTGYNYTAACAGDTGDGIEMALAAGAAKSDFNESMSGVFCADPYDMPTIGQKNNSYPWTCLLVNNDAERPVSEAAGTHDQMVYYINMGEADYGWVIMDEEIAADFLNLDEYLNSSASYIEAYKEDSVEALAADMNVDAEKLQATIDRYNELCAAGEDTDCGKAAEYLSAIDDGTYYAVKEYDMTRSNYGGIKTGLNAAVLNEAGEEISGLYAAGIISSGDTFGDYYPGGEALAVGVYMGYIAGTNAAANAAK